MKYIFVLFAALFCISTVYGSIISNREDVVEPVHEAEPWEENPLISRITDPEILRKLRGLRQQVIDTGCNINLCFALQADDFISDAEYEDQQNFVDLLVAILTTDTPGNYCAVGYGRTTNRIQRLTGDKIKFLDNVRDSVRVGGYDTNIAAALGYTGFQLRSRLEDANKIIILGDGLESVGFVPKKIAKKIRSEGTDISAVAVGGFSIDALTEIVGGDTNKIFQIHDFFELAEVVFGLVYDVCGYAL